jgi:hypothetical protein
MSYQNAPGGAGFPIGADPAGDADSPALGWTSASSSSSHPGAASGYQVPDMPNPYAPIAVASALMAASDQADQQQTAQNGSSPALSRMTTPPPSQSRTGSGEDVWVTVPIDKVEVANGKGTVTPLYAQGTGYGPPANGKGQTIPPVSTTGTRGVPAPAARGGGQ